MNPAQKTGTTLDMTTLILALLCLSTAAALLVALSVIDLRVRLLPDRLVGPLALLALVFHSVSAFHFVTLPEIVYGAALGGGILYGIRFVANYVYKQDTLGLGDVKLLLAAGMWLGTDGVLLAMTLGAACGLVHGLGVALYQKYVKKQPFSLARLEVPAGPGFAVGIALAALYKFSSIMVVMG